MTKTTVKITKTSEIKKPLTKAQLMRQINAIMVDADNKTANKINKLLKANGYWYAEMTCHCVDDNGKLHNNNRGGMQLLIDGPLTFDRDCKSYFLTLKDIKKEQDVK